jgi:hypothetical protein
VTAPSLTPPPYNVRAARGGFGDTTEARYNEICTEVTQLLHRVGYRGDPKTPRVQCVPVSGWLGDNVTQPSTRWPWYRGECATSGPRPPGCTHTHTQPLPPRSK